MTLPTFVIDQLEPSNYAWRLLVGEDTLEEDVGETSVTGCLQSAVGYAPDCFQQIEIRYQGFHMGTFRIDEIAQRPGPIADEIMASYSRLI